MRGVFRRPLVGRAGGLGDIEPDGTNAAEAFHSGERIVPAAAGKIGNAGVVQIDAIEQPVMMKRERYFIDDAS